MKAHVLKFSRFVNESRTDSPWFLPISRALAGAVELDETTKVRVNDETGEITIDFWYRVSDYYDLDWPDPNARFDLNKELVIVPEFEEIEPELEPLFRAQVKASPENFFDLVKGFTTSSSWTLRSKEADLSYTEKTGNVDFLRLDSGDPSEELFTIFGDLVISALDFYPTEYEIKSILRELSGDSNPE